MEDNDRHGYANSHSVALNRVGWELAVILGKVDPETGDVYEGDIDELLAELRERAVIRTPRTLPVADFVIEEDSPGEMIESAVAQFGGYLSMCWEYPWNSGVFESTAAKEAVDTLVNYLNDKM